MRELNISPKDVVLVGDRLCTDIRMGNEAKMTTICVLSGESSREMIEKSIYRPDIILKEITDITNYLDD